MKPDSKFRKYGLFKVEGTLLMCESFKKTVYDVGDSS